MNTGIVIRQEKTLDGLRSRLYDTLDEVIKGNIQSSQVECICAVSEQIITSAKLEVDTMMRLAEHNRLEESRSIDAANRLKDVIMEIEEC